ncbi:bifunctional GNAT family N-acetyltransferase/(deoxy)nucleoside triphosphate pyrophosphohydrolase [Pararoseomonas indoligenes]|uniref:bifunctional GNAT family N-acetyltransferase/(deoxy)nucleoside triphosphate pyrophosphohydrolase n=1 Tax=Roseomonas indoligenes TaxID=2820811 RepID=UPI00247701DA|nr:bifunctional GNAT family N-acetyltransferase/(deoxy)nucleoside triphosphate pyrophosphohydrolase [Pararoseomonas indoligenes]
MPDAIFAPLKAGSLTLRALRAADAPQLHRLVNDWEVARMLARVPFPYSLELAEDWIASTRAQIEAGTAWHLAVERDGALLGCVGLTTARDAPRHAELGYWVGRRHWGQGIGPEAAGRLARWALANLDIDVIHASVLEENKRSAAVLARIGFLEDGMAEQDFTARNARLPVRRFRAGRAELSAAREPVPVPEAPADAAPPPLAPGANLLLVAACALIDSDGRVLLARRPEGKPMAGLWEFPGGKLAPGETPEDALIRELHEELGIDVSAACLAPFAFASHPLEGKHLLMPLYLCRRWNGTPEGREGQALAWVRPNKLADYAMPPADKPLVALLRDFL